MLFLARVRVGRDRRSRQAPLRFAPLRPPQRVTVTERTRAAQPVRNDRDAGLKVEPAVDASTCSPARLSRVAASAGGAMTGKPD
ncbi:hypothetical protein Asi02nite_02890 [Asanoa siamensis]|uniref:Uncharacterized protein n=1 Tax=Asanoa siamensis TaxID=926357 RepID=A0ABQ4CHJ7_9ACTN|nr:hypothetical protein Asi02nite_02890 [Asanoa siamensis]